MKDKLLLQKIIRRSRAGGQTATVLSLLCCATLLTGCAADTMRGFLRTEIPDSFLQVGKPGVVADAAAATQADAAQAYADTYVAWEGCAANLDRIRELLAAQDSVGRSTKKR